ncbi:MAG: FAD-binding oxidoreductase [Deltaproteobacteria bacterium]|nr:FAD-binding oxidoreductase [Deltaproteobacteria bacterium]
MLRDLQAVTAGRVYDRSAFVVVEPAHRDDVSAVARFCSARGVALSTLGTGHAQRPHALFNGGVVLDMRALNAIVRVDEEAIVAGAGARWFEIADAALAIDRAPPVLPTCLELSIGGTHATGGIGVASFRHGQQIDHCLALDVVMANGEQTTCTPGDALFLACLGGLGQCAIITQVTHALRPVARDSREYRLSYSDHAAFAADCATLADEPDVEAIDAQAVPDGRFQILVRREGPALHASHAAFIERRSARAGMHRDRPTKVALLPDTPTTDAFLPLIGAWDEHFVPANAAPDVTRAMLSLVPSDWLARGHVLLWQLAARGSPPFMPRPPGDRLALISVRAPTDAVDLTAMAGISEVAREAGGTRYVSRYRAADRSTWSAHFGAGWPTVNALKRRFDPQGILNGGVIAYEEDQRSEGQHG